MKNDSMEGWRDWERKKLVYKNKERGAIWKGMRFVEQGLLNCVFPPRCPLCDQVIARPARVCQHCRKKVKRIQEPLCKKCGKPLEDMRKEYCEDCMKHPHFFQEGRAVFLYEEEMRLSLYRFKYSNKREYAEFYAKETKEVWGEWVKRQGIEVIIPVPMYSWKKRLRGYNQAESYARALGKVMQLPVDTGYVFRKRDTTPQKTLNRTERRKNLLGAFEVSSHHVPYQTILLADDIYTTGSTMDAVSRELIRAGVESIFCISVSIGSF